MKKLIKFTLFCCLICCAFAVCGCSKSNKKSNIDWDGLTIENFTNYAYIGVSATQDGPVAQNSSVCKASRLTNSTHLNEGDEDAVIIQDSAPEEPVKLVGITDSNKCEEMRFVNDKGDIFKQNAHLIRLDTYKRFSFAIFSTESNDYIDTSWGKEFDEMEYVFYLYDMEIVYKLNGAWLGSDKFDYERINPYFVIIDNYSGNIYSMNDIRDKFVKLTGARKFSRISFLKDSLQRDFIMFKVEKWPDSGYLYDYTLYQIKFTDSNIEIVERMNNTQIKNFLGGAVDVNYLTFDHFGNIFRTMKFNGTSWEYELTPKNGSRYQRSDGIFDTLNFTDERYPGNAYMATYSLFNHVLIRRTYAEPHSNLNLETVSYLNDNGEFVPADIDLPDSWGNLDTMYHEGNIYYRVDRDSFTNEEGAHRQTITLTKITLSEQCPWDWKIENLLLEDEWTNDYLVNNQTMVRNEALVKNSAFGNGFMYSHYNGDFYIYDMKTGARQIINNGETITKVYFDKKISVMKAIFVDSKSMENVTGYFTNNNELVIENLSNLYYGNKRVFAINPLNRKKNN